MKQETYKKLKRTTEYRAYISLGMQDTTKESELEKGIIKFFDNSADCEYTFNVASGYARRIYWKQCYEHFPACVKVSYQLNPRQSAPSFSDNNISWTQTFPGNMKKLLSIGISPAIQYNVKRRKEFNKKIFELFSESLK